MKQTNVVEVAKLLLEDNSSFAVVYSNNKLEFFKSARTKTVIAQVTLMDGQTVVGSDGNALVHGKYSYENNTLTLVKAEEKGVVAKVAAKVRGSSPVSRFVRGI